jgi:hypothetical protein
LRHPHGNGLLIGALDYHGAALAQMPRRIQ